MASVKPAMSLKRARALMMPVIGPVLEDAGIVAGGKQREVSPPPLGKRVRVAGVDKENSGKENSEAEVTAAAGAGYDVCTFGVPPRKASAPPELPVEPLAEWWNAPGLADFQLPRAVAAMFEGVVPPPRREGPHGTPSRKRAPAEDLADIGEVLDDGTVADAEAGGSPQVAPNKRRVALEADDEFFSPAQARSLLDAATSREDDLLAQLALKNKEAYVLKRAVAIQAAQNKQMLSSMESKNEELQRLKAEVVGLKQVNYELTLHLRAGDNPHHHVNPYGDVH